MRRSLLFKIINTEYKLRFIDLRAKFLGALLQALTTILFQFYACLTVTLVITDALTYYVRDIVRYTSANIFCERHYFSSLTASDALCNVCSFTINAVTSAKIIISSVPLPLNLSKGPGERFQKKNSVDLYYDTTRTIYHYGVIKN